MSTRRVVVLGGGLSGVASAWALAEAGWKDVDDLIRRAREAPDPDGEARFVRAIFLPEDSSFLLLYEAGSARDAAAAAAALEFEVERVSEVVSLDEQEDADIV